VKKDLAFATVESYGNILESTWRPAIGELIFEEVKYLDAGENRGCEMGDLKEDSQQCREHHPLRVRVWVSRSCDLTQGRLKVSRARVMNRDKDRTKTRVDRNAHERSMRSSVSWH
jgi:hypothetical protein